MNLYMEYVCTEPGVDKSLISEGFPASQEYYIHWSIVDHVSVLTTSRSPELHNIQGTRALPSKLSYSSGGTGANYMLNTGGVWAEREAWVTTLAPLKGLTSKAGLGLTIPGFLKGKSIYYTL